MGVIVHVRLCHLLLLAALIFRSHGDEDDAVDAARQRRQLSSQWQWGSFSPWGAPKPKQPQQPQTTTPTDLLTGYEGAEKGNRLKCTMQKFEGIYFYGTLNAVAKNVGNVDLCVGVCWQMRAKGKQCASVNYLKKQYKCEIMDDQLRVQKIFMLQYLAESDPNAVYAVPVTCNEAGPVPQVPPPPPPPPTPAPPSEGALAPPGSCGHTFVEPRISKDILSGKTMARIIGGTEARPHSFPWLVGFQEDGDHFCGGTLVRVHPIREESDIVVTAAHCLQDHPHNLRLLLGAHSLKRNPAPNMKRLSAATYVMHPEYDRDTTNNDIALVKLNQTVRFSRTIQPACLPEYGEYVKEGQTAIVAGWGSMQEFLHRMPDVLMQVPVNTFSYDICATKFYPGEMYSPQMFCAGHMEGGRDSCQGDSGGPLIFKTPKGWMLRGVVSFGEGCARAGKPGVYANVSHYIPWIRGNIAKLTSVKP